MRTKLVLLFVAAIGSTALVASAQTTLRSTVVRNPESGGVENVFVAVPAHPQPPQPPVAVPAPPAPATIDVFGPVRERVQRDQQGRFVTFHAFEDGGSSQQVELLAQQLLAAKSDSDRDRIKNQLVEQLEKQFDRRQKRHEEEIKQLEAQIKKLKEMVEKRQENRREIVVRRLEQVIRESQGLGW